MYADSKRWPSWPIRCLNCLQVVVVVASVVALVVAVVVAEHVYRLKWSSLTPTDPFGVCSVHLFLRPQPVGIDFYEARELVRFPFL